jgi:hypothetical protein
MKKINPIIISSIIISLSVILTVLLYRDVELKKLSVDAARRVKIEECITSVKKRYALAANKGKGILDYEQIMVMKEQNNSEEDRCIERYK